jgi:hypothetical protein
MAWVIGFLLESWVLNQSGAGYPPLYPERDGGDKHASARFSKFEIHRRNLFHELRKAKGALASICS